MPINNYLLCVLAYEFLKVKQKINYLCAKFLSYFVRLKFKSIPIFTKIFLSNLKGAGDIDGELP